MSAPRRPDPEPKPKPKGDYEVGYGKPPVKYQFKKGESGNPEGASVKVKSEPGASIAVFADAAEILNEKIIINENGRKRKETKGKILVRRFIHTALQSGDPKVLAEAMKFMEKVDRAMLEGRGNEPLRIIIEGGLPDNEPIPPADDDDSPPRDALPFI